LPHPQQEVKRHVLFDLECILNSNQNPLDEVDHIDTSKTDYSTDFDTSQTATPADTTDLREGTESIAGSDAPTPNSTTDRKRKEDPKFKSWQKNINLLWREIANHKNGAMFMNPIKESIAPQYYDIVKRPMDMKTIKNRIRDGVKCAHFIFFTGKLTLFFS
jgi:bromodomain-containing protein 8